MGDISLLEFQGSIMIEADPIHDWQLGYDNSQMSGFTSISQLCWQTSGIIQPIANHARRSLWKNSSESKCERWGMPNMIGCKTFLFFKSHTDMLQLSPHLSILMQLAPHQVVLLYCTLLRPEGYQESLWWFGHIMAYIAAFGGCRLPSDRATEDMLVLAKAFQAYKEQVLAP